MTLFEILKHFNDTPPFHAIRHEGRPYGVLTTRISQLEGQYIQMNVE